MSRIGLMPITIPQGVTVEIKDGGRFNYKQIVVNGPKGTLSEDIRRGVTFNLEGDTLTVARDNESKENKSFHGLYRSLVANMVKGVTVGFSRELEIVGIGYRAEQQGNKVVFSLGLSHKITFEPPVGIAVIVEDQTKVKVEGINKQQVNEIAAKIRDFRSPEPYKGKGVRYAGENVRRKSTKAGAD